MRDEERDMMTEPRRQRHEDRGMKKEMYLKNKTDDDDYCNHC